jgi:hypothetical protein
MYRRIATVLAAVIAVLVGLSGAAQASLPGGSQARAVIPGCQTVTMDDSVPPFPLSVKWKADEVAHDYGAYRISGGCGQALQARLLGIGPDSSLRCAGVYVHVQRDDGTWYRTSTVHICTNQGANPIAGFLPINHHFYLHCADSQAPPQQNLPCRVRFTF